MSTCQHGRSLGPFQFRAFPVQGLSVGLLISMPDSMWCRIEDMEFEGYGVALWPCIPDSTVNKVSSALESVCAPAQLVSSTVLPPGIISQA